MTIDGGVTSAQPAPGAPASSGAPPAPHRSVGLSRPGSEPAVDSHPCHRDRLGGSRAGVIVRTKPTPHGNEWTHTMQIGFVEVFVDDQDHASDS